MGLDMYLVRGPKGETTIDSEEVGYWRKANAVHNWFAQNCQNGVDECQYTTVPKEKLEELLNICKQVLADELSTDTAERLLPVTAGFFFGSYAYDEWYYDKVRNTQEILEAVLADTDFETDEIGYQSSW